MMSTIDIDMTINYIYLLQEREFIKTKENIYKVGMTTKENHIRFNQYPKGSILMFQMICYDCKNIEKQIIELFKENKDIKHRTDIGREYFEGEYKNMINIIYLTIRDELICDEKVTHYMEEPITNNEVQLEDDNIDDKYDDCDEDEDDEQIKKIKFNLLCEKICKIFPDYKNDESFGGNKKYIKFNMINEEYSIYYINPFLMDDLHYYYENECETRFDEYIIIQYDMNKNVADRLQYFNKLISKKAISIDKIYDMNSINFIDKINNTKFSLEIENFNEFNSYTSNNKFYSKIREKLRQLFHCNMIINRCLYSTMVKEDDNYNIFKIFKNLKDFDNFRIDVGIDNYIMTTIYKINSKFYDYKTYLRKYTPYVIRWNTENNYYILNRDYEYIGMNTKSIEEELNSEALFNDGTKPWEEEQHLIKMLNNYEKIIKEKELKECLNKNEFTQNILSLY